MKVPNIGNKLTLTESRGDIWDYHLQGSVIVIPTNVGWKSNGANIMGAGLAKEALTIYPWLDKFYGKWCRTYDSLICPLPDHRLILFPTKPLLDKPHLSWRGKSNLHTIEASTVQLNLYQIWTALDNIVMPRIGCGNGGLDWGQVKPILETNLFNIQFFTVVDKRG